MELIDFLRKYYEAGLSVIPLQFGEKKPLISWEEYQHRRATWEEIEGWLKKYKNMNIGIVCGAVSGNLIVIDFDSTDRYQKFIENLPPKFNFKTWVVMTARGVHVYFRLNNPASTKPKIVEKVDIKGEGGYVVAPPSLHPDGESRYFFFMDSDRNPIQRLSDEEYEIVLNTIKKAFEIKEEPKEVKMEEIKFRELSDEKIKEIVSLISPYYKKGYRDLIAFHLIGFLIKNGIDYDSTKKVIELLATNNNDEEIKARLYLVDWHYKKVRGNETIEKLKGISGISEVLDKILREEGKTDDEATEIRSSVLTQLNSILGINKGKAAWIERQGGIIRKWVALGNQGIYLFKKVNEESEPVVSIISSAIIRKVKAIKIKGLDLRNLFEVTFDEETISGTIEDIIAYINKFKGIESGKEYAVERLIQAMAEEEVELFYAPGPWIVDRKIVFAKESGYMPTWKPYIVWKVPSDDVSDEKKKEVLMKIKQLVNSYSDPTKPSYVLSYVAISPFAHYIKKELSIMPHLIIHGLNNTGKTVLLDLIKRLYNYNWEEACPMSDYQARRDLTASTLPQIIDEIGSIIEGYKKETKNAIEVIEIWHRAATQEAMRIAGGVGYSGIFLAIRSIIAATNGDVSLVPWQLDKFYLVTISIAEKIDINKARGATIRTMSEEHRNIIPIIGKELMMEFEKLIPQIDELKKLSREDIKNKLIELGYKAWHNLYKKYGLEPFTSPNTNDVVLQEVESETEQYKDIFLSYVLTKRNSSKPDERIEEFLTEIEVDEAALESLNNKLAIITKADVTQGGTRVLLCKPPFITKFCEYVVKEFGLPRLGWKRMAEILGLKKTRRKIGNQIVNHIYMWTF